jgi:opacity protein-like surface antigen
MKCCRVFLALVPVLVSLPLRVLMVVAAIAMVAPLPALAQQASPPLTQFAIAPFIGYRGGGSFTETTTGAKLKLDPAQSYGLVADIRITRETEVELLWSRQRTQLKADVPVTVPLFHTYVDYYHIGGTFLFATEGVQPFFVATIGATRFSPQQAGFENDTKFSFGVGGGVRIPLARNFGLRFEGRAYGTVLSNDSSVLCSGATCLIHADGTLLWQYEANAGVYLAF